MKVSPNPNPEYGAQTGGRGVDMALNSLADDKLQATVRCLAPHGQLLEIGKYDILKNTPLGMRPMHANISFQGIDLDSLFKGVMQDQARPALLQNIFLDLEWCRI